MKNKSLFLAIMVSLSCVSYSNATPYDVDVKVVEPTCISEGYTEHTRENFFGLMKKEMFFNHQFEFDNYEQFKIAIDNYIYWYNNKRIKTKLKGLSPVQYRIQSLQQSV